jgi:transketolase
MADLPGISYIRTTRANTPVLYRPEDEFPIGGSRVVRGGAADDRVTVVAAGITVHESVKAADELAKSGIKIRLIDAYSVKPLDASGIAKAVQATGGRLVIVEDHWPDGGLGDAVVSGLVALGVKDIAYGTSPCATCPRRGSPRSSSRLPGSARAMSPRPCALCSPDAGPQDLADRAFAGRDRLDLPRRSAHRT